MIKHSNWYWIKEFVGDGIMWLTIGWSSMLFGGIATVGYAKFIEPNPWILYTEIAILVLFAFVAADRTIDDGIRYDQERRLK